MSIYRIVHNIKDFMFFTIDDLDVYSKMGNFDIDGFGLPLKFKWVVPKAEFIPSDAGSLVVPDITQWNGTDLILNEKAKVILCNELKILGEFYALTGACKEQWLFNPIIRMGNEIIDLDKTKSSYFEDGSWKQLELLVFNSDIEQLLPSVFSLSIDGGVNLYCSEVFKASVEKNQLKGLLFEKIG